MSNLKLIILNLEEGGAGAVLLHFVTKAGDGVADETVVAPAAAVEVRPVAPGVRAPTAPPAAKAAAEEPEHAVVGAQQWENKASFCAKN